MGDNRRIGIRKKNTVFTSWIILFFAMTLIAFFIMGIYFYTMNRALEKNLKQYDEAKIKQISNQVDIATTRLAMFAVSFSNDDILKRQEPYSLEEYKEILNDIAIQMELNRDIYSICLYFPQSGEIVANKCVTKSNFFYAAYFNTGFMSLEEWNALLKDTRSDYFCLLPFSDTLGNEYKLTYVLNSEKTNAKIMVALNFENIMSEDPYFSKMLIQNENGNIYQIYGKERNSDTVSAEILPTGDEKIDDDHSYISYVSSAFPGIGYIMFTEKNIFNKDLSSLQMFSFVYLFAFLVLGFVLARIFAARQYKPINSILDILKSERGEDPIAKSDNLNEYDEIENTVSKIIGEKLAFSREIFKRDVYIKEKAISNLLNGQVLNREMSEMLSLPQGEFTIVRVIWNPEKTQLFENDLELIRFAVKNITEEMFSKIAKSYAAEMDGGVNLLLAFGGENAQKLRAEAAEISEDFCEIMKAQFDMEVAVILGGFAENERLLPKIYGEMLESRMFSDSYGTVTDIDEIDGAEHESYNYSVQSEIEIIFYIKRGDFDGAMGIINRELDEVKYRKNYPAYLIRCMMIELASTIFKAAEEIKKVNAIDFSINTGNIGKLFSATSINEMELLIRDYLKEVCDFVVATNATLSSSNCEYIKRYVREHFTDYELNVNKIADALKINSAYLSNMFRKNTGIRLSEYINKIRVEEAKRLLVQMPEMSMELIAEKSGFANSRSFRRIFQKFEGKPPSQFIRS